MSSELNRFQILLNKALDGLLSTEENAEFENLLASSKECQEEWQSMKRLKEVTREMKFKNPPDEIWDKYWLGIYARLERGLAWILVSIGATVLLVYGGFKVVEELIADPTLAWFIKIAILAIIAGLAILFVSVLRERLFVRKTDKYKEIVR
ncbi:MAG: hypothetical protein KKG06_08990 [Bacteroidetes bacterium]|nr:hypothetical protein [Bacteroidota bacterium]MBU1423295.1 hypothetical protein [Bacteroidota bacterium]